MSRFVAGVVTTGAADLDQLHGVFPATDRLKEMRLCPSSIGRTPISNTSNTFGCFVPLD